MEKLYTSKTCLKMAVGGWISLILPPGSASGRKLRKLSKESGLFHNLAPLILFFFTERQSQRGGGASPNAPPKYAPGYRFGIFWIRFPNRSNWTPCCQWLVTAATFLRSCVAQALACGDGPHHSLHVWA